MKLVRAVVAVAAVLLLPALARAQDEAAPPRVPVPKEITTVKATRSATKTVKTAVPIQRVAHDPSAAAFRGEGWFQQQCAVCHSGRWRKQGQLQPYAPPLTGVLKNADTAREKVVRAFIEAGSQNMPGFRNTFTATEFDELIAYLKTL
jgi:mono/diheme cytochrome c family protein